MLCSPATVVIDVRVTVVAVVVLMVVDETVLVVWVMVVRVEVRDVAVYVALV